MREVESKRHVTAERQPRDHRAFRAAGVEHRGHVGDRGLVGIALQLLGRIRAVMTAHVPGDEVVVIGKRLHLPTPHSRAGAVAMTQQYRGTCSAFLVIDAHTVAIEIRHSARILPQHAGPFQTGPRERLELPNCFLRRR